MVRGQWGRIINISSIYEYCSAEGNLPYTVSKHGLAALVRTIAKEYGGCGITANNICPGPVRSRMMGRIALAARGTEGVEDYLKEVEQELPIGRLIKPEEIAWAAEFLMAEESSGISGIALPVDGGMTA